MRRLSSVVLFVGAACVFVACSSSGTDAAAPPEPAPGVDSGVPDGSSGPLGEDATAADAAIEPFGPLVVALSTSSVTIKQGRSVTFDVTVTRPAGVTGVVDVDVNSLPAGAGAKTVHIAAGETKGTVQIDASDVTPQGSSNASVVVTSGTRSDGVAALAVTVVGRPGTLDTSYGIAGRTVQPAPAFLNGVGGLALQASGSTVLSVSSQVMRIGTNGVRDTAFGTASVGNVPGNWPGFIGVDASDRPVIAYRSNSGSPGASTAGVVRLQPGGLPDTTFGTNGTVSVNWGSPIDAFDDNVQSVGLEPDGRLVVAGDRATSKVGAFIYSRVSIVRLLENGQPDPSFARYDAPYDSYGPHVVRASDGSWVVATKSGQIYRLTSAGALDATFHGGTPAPGSAGALLVLADGKIVWGNGGSIGRLLANGTPDTSFATTGTFTVPVGGPGIAALALQSDGAIVATGGANSDFSTIRVLANGTLDTDFGTNGIAQTDIASVGDSAGGVSIQADGKIVVAGVSGGKVAFVRYWP